MAEHTNRLADSGKPLFFPVEGATSALRPPAPRAGDSVRLYVRSLSVMQKEALVVDTRSERAWRLSSDEGAYLDGFDEAPCPLSFLTVGMVSSFMNEILALAKQRDIDIHVIRLVQDNYYTMSGSALRQTMIGGARDIDLEARISSDADRDTLTRLVNDAVNASPVSGLMRGENESLFTLTHNGGTTTTAKAKPVGGDALPDPGDVFDGIHPAAGDWSGLIRRGGMTPKNEETDSSSGSSLAEEQNRLLHVRGICTLRDDGVKHIEQHMYNPHGSIFHYLSDEQGRAPDAISYISAGIGFCFMTQLGRYATIVNKDLQSYRIVQDAHFSKGGGSDATGEPGAADPLETHVHLRSGEDDEFARTTLDMGERTCFLHAFCRTDLKANVRITSPG